MSNLITITDSQLETELNNTKQPVLLYFWADWCGPCKLVSPAIQWVANNYSDRLKVLKLEVDPNPDAVHKYGVEGVPALRLIKENEVLISFEGAITKDKLNTLLSPHLA